MLDVYSDLTQQSGAFGSHFENLEMCELSDLRKKVNAGSVPGPILQIGNTNSRYRFGIGAKAFTNDWARGGPSHHCSIGVGHMASKIAKLGELLGLDVNNVC